MNLKVFRIKNFRGYSDEISIDINNLTALVGKNDIGKSTILEAMNIFFNGGDSKQLIPIDKDDINKQCEIDGDNEIVFSACFDNLPDKIQLDATYLTNLKDEYLLNQNGHLEIVKRYPNANPKEKIFIKAMHPSNPNCTALLSKKNTDLKKIIEANAIACENKTVNSLMRRSIWDHYKDDLQLKEIEIDVSKGDTDGIKSIWEKLKDYLPLYSLFQADRKNTDTDDEVQDPLQAAVKQIISTKEIQDKLKEISDIVLNELQIIASNTLDKLKNINENLANTLEPKIPEVGNLKWADVFKKVSITSNNGIPINKRGSGVKRLILLSFFQAEAEKKKTEFNNRGVIYAIEEPETSQHYEHHRMLINALKRISLYDDTQVLITTHSSLVLKEVKFDDIRIIDGEIGKKKIKLVEKHYLPNPSTNEINYLTFGEITEEYHQELYGYLFIESGCTGEAPFNKWLINSKNLQIKKVWQFRDKKTKAITPQDACLPYYIRNSIDHPENTLNPRYSASELKKSIEEMQQVVSSIK